MTLHAGLLRGHHLGRPLASGLDIEGLRVACRHARNLGDLLNNPAYAYQAAGDLIRAIALYEVTLTDLRRIPGEDHPLTITVHRNLCAMARG